MAQKPTSTGLINLGEWLRANRTGADALGTRLAADAGREVDAAERGLTDVANEFTMRANAQMPGELPTEPKADQFKKEDGTTDWVAFNKAKEAYKASLQSAIDRQYKGPQGLDEIESYATAERRAQQAVQRGASLGSESGRAQQLGQIYSRPDYSAGLKAADAFLAGASSAGQNAISNTQAKLTKLQPFLADAMAKSKAQVRTTQEAIAARGKEAKEALDRFNTPPPEPPAPPEVDDGPEPPPYKDDQLENNRRRRRGEDYYGNDTTYP